jgi:hypothetical protein
MSQKYLDYLNREHARLEQEIEVLMKRRLPDEIGIARLKKLKLAVKDQIAHIQSDEYPALVAKNGMRDRSPVPHHSPA